MTPLHWASRNSHVAVIKYLVETAKADVEAKDVSGVSHAPRGVSRGRGGAWCAGRG